MRDPQLYCKTKDGAYSLCFIEEIEWIQHVYYDYYNKPIKDFHGKVRDSRYDIQSFAKRYFEGDML